MDKGFPKGGGGGGGGGADVWEKFPNNMVFFLRAYLSRLKSLSMCLMFSIEEAIKPIYINYMVCGMPRAIVKKQVLEVNVDNYFIE